MNRQTLGTVLKYLLAVGLLTWVIKSNWGTVGSHGLGDVWRCHVLGDKTVDVGSVHLEFFLAAFLIYSVATCITLLRWYILVRAQNLAVTLRDAIRLGLIGCYYNAFLPGSVGGDIIKAAYLAHGQTRRTVAVATVIMDRMIALWGLVWFVAVLGGGFWLAGSLDDAAGQRCQVIVFMALTIVAVSWALWMLLGFMSDLRADRFASRLETLPRVGASAAEFWRAVWIYRQRPASVMFVLMLSWIGHVGFCVAFYCCARTFGDNPRDIPTLTQHFLIVPIGLVVQALVPFPGGMGFGEMGFGFLYNLMHTGMGEKGVLASLVQRFISWCIALIGLVVSAWLKPAQLPAESKTLTSPVWTLPAGAPAPGLAVQTEHLSA